MLSFPIRPGGDDLAVFPRLLSDLTRCGSMRRSGRRSRVPSAARLLRRAPGTFKVLINSFYGYLGFGMGHFADFEPRLGSRPKEGGWSRRSRRAPGAGADPSRWTRTGSISSRRGRGRPRGRGCLRLGGQPLSARGHPARNGRPIPGMFSYKVKNYVLLTYDEISGSRDRAALPAIEKFQRVSWRRCSADPRGTAGGGGGIRDRFLDDLRSHRGRRVVRKTETLHDSSRSTARSGSRAGGTPRRLRAGAGIGAPVQPGDQITYYVTGKSKAVEPLRTQSSPRAGTVEPRRKRGPLREEARGSVQEVPAFVEAASGGSWNWTPDAEAIAPLRAAPQAARRTFGHLILDGSDSTRSRRQSMPFAVRSPGSLREAPPLLFVRSCFSGGAEVRGAHLVSVVAQVYLLLRGCHRHLSTRERVRGDRRTACSVQRPSTSYRPR